MNSKEKKHGLFVVLDGVDGCGKSTQARLLVERLERETGSEVLHLREPGSTGLGESLREQLLARHHELSPEVETLLFAASRRHMLDELVRPALESGKHVVCERFNPSTFAYQAWAGELDADEVLNLLGHWASQPAPNFIIVLDLDVEAAGRRRGAPTDRIEDKGEAFQERVAEGYRRYAELDPGTLLVDGAKAADQVAEYVWQEVKHAL